MVGQRASWSLTKLGESLMSYGSQKYTKNTPKKQPPLNTMKQRLERISGRIAQAKYKLYNDQRFSPFTLGDLKYKFFEPLHSAMYHKDYETLDGFDNLPLIKNIHKMQKALVDDLDNQRVQGEKRDFLIDILDDINDIDKELAQHLKPRQATSPPQQQKTTLFVVRKTSGNTSSLGSSQRIDSKRSPKSTSSNWSLFKPSTWPIFNKKPLRKEKTQPSSTEKDLLNNQFEENNSQTPIPSKPSNWSLFKPSTWPIFNKNKAPKIKNIKKEKIMKAPTSPDSKQIINKANIEKPQAPLLDNNPSKPDLPIAPRKTKKKRNKNKNSNSKTLPEKRKIEKTQNRQIVLNTGNSPTNIEKTGRPLPHNQNNNRTLPDLTPPNRLKEKIPNTDLIQQKIHPPENSKTLPNKEAKILNSLPKNHPKIQPRKTKKKKKKNENKKNLLNIKKEGPGLDSPPHKNINTKIEKKISDSSDGNILQKLAPEKMKNPQKDPAAIKKSGIYGKKTFERQKLNIISSKSEVIITKDGKIHPISPTLTVHTYEKKISEEIKENSREKLTQKLAEIKELDAYNRKINHPNHRIQDAETHAADLIGTYYRLKKLENDKEILQAITKETPDIRFICRKGKDETNSGTPSWVLHIGETIINGHHKGILNNDVQEIISKIDATPPTFPPIFGHDNTSKLHNPLPYLKDRELKKEPSIWAKLFGNTQPSNNDPTIEEQMDLHNNQL